MNPTLPSDALEFGETARKAFEKLGGGEFVLRCEEDLQNRLPLMRVIEELGIDYIDPREDIDQLCAAAALCDAAGRSVIPFPVIGVMLRDRVADGRVFALASEDRPRVDHGDVFGSWRVATLDGRGRPASPTKRLATRLGPFVSEMEFEEGTDFEPRWHLESLHALTLTSWLILGAADRAVELAADHVSNRIQFGKPIATFQAVQFMLADAAVAVAGLRELAQFTLWRLATDPSTAAPDALALRVHALDVARAVLRTCQQLHGASGVCDEYDISVITRHIQPALRLPFGAERSAALLVDAIAQHGFEGLFPHGGANA